MHVLLIAFHFMTSFQLNMQKYLVSLVSKQTLPNLLFILQAKDIDKYLFIGTTATEQELSRTIVAAQIPNNQVAKLIVDPYNIDDIHEKLDDFKFSKKEKFEINLTGGTKMMALGLYQFFIQKKSKLFYLPVGTNDIQQIFPKLKRPKPLKVKVTIEEYFTAMGVKLKSGKGNILQMPPDYTLQFFIAYTQLFQRRHFRIFEQLREHDFKRYPKLKCEKIIGLQPLLNTINWQKNNKLLTKQEVHYLTGGWFEEYIYHQFKVGLDLSDDAIQCNVGIETMGGQNEFDVVLIYKNKLHVIECKTGLKRLRLFNQAVYKLASLDELLGIHTASYIISLSNYRDQENLLLPTYNDRAQQHDIKLLDRQVLTGKNGIAKIIKQIKKC